MSHVFLTKLTNGHSFRSPSLIQRCWIGTATHPLRMPLDEFRDSVPRDKRAAEPVGRSWTVKELRRKSFQDLHKLWHVLYKENNMLLTEANLSRRKEIMFPQPDRRRKVRKSMGAIKAVLGERKRDKLAQVALRRLEKQQQQQEEVLDEA